jgi:hypothetical protein
MQRAERERVAMPSRAVDEAWHELILDTRRYQTFCNNAFGQFLHHKPSEPMRDPLHAQMELRRCWRLACEQEGRDRHAPGALPLLFALDAELRFPHGHYYRLGRRPAVDDDVDGPVDGVFDVEEIGCAADCGSGSGGDGSCGGGCGGD